MTSSLFDFIAGLHAGRPWGAVLDAGSGVNSTSWVAGLPTERWTAVTAAPGHAAQIRAAVAPRMRDGDRLMVGNWMDDSLLAGEVYDTVLADYLLGAVEGFGPYFEQQLFRRLRRHVGRTLYVVGLDPYIVGDAPTPAAAMVRAIGRLRDACLLLADETPYREYPAEWAINSLGEAGFRVAGAHRFPNRYKARWVNAQLDMAARRLPKFADASLAQAFGARIEALRSAALELCEREGGLRHGCDYVIACETTGA